MTDIFIGIILIVLLAVLMFSAAVFLAGKCSKRCSIIVAAVILSLLILSVIFSPHDWMARLLPFSNVIIFADPVLLPTAIFAGLAWKLMPGRKYRKVLVLGPLSIVVLYSSFAFLFRPIPPTGSKWKDGVCLQSSESSCSAACTATLLKHYGIDATEKEMAELCFTRDNGTALLGTYRGLKIKTAGTKYSVRLEKWSLEELLNTKFPVIIQAKLKSGSNSDPRYVREWGWTPGVSHAVIFYGRGDGDKVKIADPSVGRENWRVEGIKTLWHGNVIFLTEDN